MGVDYTAKVVVGVLLTDEQERRYRDWYEEVGWKAAEDVDNHVFDAGDYYGGGTQRVVGAFVDSSDWGWSETSLPTDGDWRKAHEAIDKFVEATGIQITHDIKTYIGLLVH